MADDRQRGDPSLSPAIQPASPDSTMSLLERVRAGDEEALNRLLARHLAPLSRFAKGRLPMWARDVADTDDLVQDTLFQTLRRIGEFDVRGAGALQAYLRQAIVNRVRDELRKKAHRPATTAFNGSEVDDGLSPLELAIGREGIERYERALAALDPDDQEAVVGRLEMGYAYDELAEVLGKPSADAARKAAGRALVRLIELMNSPEPNHAGT